MIEDFQKMVADCKYAGKYAACKTNRFIHLAFKKREKENDIKMHDFDRKARKPRFMYIFLV